MLERQKRRIREAAAPYLEEGETVTACFVGQTPIPPIAYALVAPIVFIFVIKIKTFVATERHLYVFPHKWMRTYTYSGPPYKVPISDARVETGSMWIRADGGPKVWAPPLGPVRRGMLEVRDAVAAAQGVAPGAERP